MFDNYKSECPKKKMSLKTVFNANVTSLTSIVQTVLLIKGKLV